MKFALFSEVLAKDYEYIIQFGCDYISRVITYWAW